MGKGFARGRIFSACLFGPFLTKKKGLALAAMSVTKRHAKRVYTANQQEVAAR
jgi:hypothetical protein